MKIIQKQGEAPLVLFLIISSFILILLFTSFGSVKVPVKDIFASLIGKNSNDIYKNLILNIRLPRVVGSFLVGSILAVSGNVLQLVVQNPLADPYILGISSGASFGAVLYTALGSIYGLSLFLGLETFSFIFGLLATFIVLVLAQQGKKLPVLSLILSGVIISFLFNSFTTLFTVMYWRNLIHVNIWLMGSTGDLIWSDNFKLFFTLIIQFILVLLFSKQLNVLSMGDNMAVFSGINPDRLKLFLIVINVFAVSFTVSQVGIIGFVGLIIPHIVRMVKGPYSFISNLYSLFIGGMFLMSADFVSRTLFAPTELPIGVVTSIVGAPIFIFVMRRKERI
ncbi:FecCD family ABC transporter permease [Petrotoga olearia]|uniref:ABC transporter permease n=2 Tax=Petrotoga olearia TaxID=156203 RepID=A0A2K1NWM2_9BACT|nr:iron ABC transporter permease [Petrotoga olearia]KUK15312.1 MAG: Transport system permease protein [Petrotoga mobilis]PNR94936.1 ABC transporter permease [Petrotoga olearia DSM 13574]RMA73234.1 iron complex transport system permease protein [Petrotoga olearia]